MRANIQQVSDTAVRVQFGSAIDPALTYILLDFVYRLEVQNITGITHWEFTYTTATVHFEPWHVAGPEVIQQLREICRTISIDGIHKSGREIEVPVCYGDEYGPDLDDVAQYHEISREDVIKRHVAPAYPVAFIGFAPGFPYLIGLNPSLETPRLATPRLRVSAGSVGIGGSQTGIYPNASPAGWRIIGRTPLRLFDKTKETASLCQAGDTLRFVQIDRDQFQEYR